MGNRTGLINRMVAAIIASRFAPIEFVLACSSVVHGIWLVLLGWHISTAFQMLPAPWNVLELGYSWYMIIVGVGVLASARAEWSLVRSVCNLILFVGWTFSGLLAFFATGPSGILWIAYLTMALIQALVYLNVRVGVWDGND